MEIIILGLIHWKLSNNLKGKFKEDLFALFSLINILLIIFFLYIISPTFINSINQDINTERLSIFFRFILIPTLTFSAILTSIFGLVLATTIRKDSPCE